MGLRLCSYLAMATGGATLACLLIMWAVRDRQNPLRLAAFLTGLQSGLFSVPASLGVLGAALYARAWNRAASAGLALGLAGAAIYLYWIRMFAD